MITVKNDRLISFMYALLRDELPVGRVVQMLVNIRKESPDEEAHLYGNDHLASMAIDMAEWLKTGGGALEKMFEEMDSVNKSNTCVEGACNAEDTA